MSKYIVVFTFFISSFVAFGQSVIFEGEIHYVTTYTYFPPGMEGYKPYLPVTIDFYIRKNLVCKEGPTGFANGYQIHVHNLATNSGYTAMRIGDNSLAYRRVPESYQIEIENMVTPTSIEYLNDTRTIGGFLCKKALVYMPDSSKPYTIYYTDQIPSEANTIYKGLKGFPLYFEGTLNGVLYYSEAKSVHPKPQEDSKFLLPNEYHVVPYDEFKKALIKDFD